MDLDTLKGYNHINNIGITDTEFDKIEREVKDRSKYGICVPVTKDNCYITINHDNDKTIKISGRMIRMAKGGGTITTPFRLLFNTIILFDIPKEIFTYHSIFMEKNDMPQQRMDCFIDSNKKLKWRIHKLFQDELKEVQLIETTDNLKEVKIKFKELEVNLKIEGRACLINGIRVKPTDVMETLRRAQYFKDQETLTEFLKAVRRVGIDTIDLLTEEEFVRFLEIRPSIDNSLTKKDIEVVVYFKIERKASNIYLITNNEQEYKVKSFTDLNNFVAAFDLPMNGHQKLELASKHLFKALENFKPKDFVMLSNTIQIGKRDKNRRKV
jgi:hypothetical protein